MEPDPRWISADIQRARIVAPDGTSIALDEGRAGTEVGYVLDRKFFDRELVWKASEAGADVFVKTRAVAPIIEEGRVCGAYGGVLREAVRLHGQGQQRRRGVGSKLARGT